MRSALQQQQLQQTATTATTSNGGVGAVAGTNVKDKMEQMYVTYVDTLGAYLRISGQVDLRAKSTLHSNVQEILSDCFAISPSWPVTRQMALLNPGVLCLYKRVTGGNVEFLRASITKVTVPNAQMQIQTSVHVEVDFIDYGYTSQLTSYELLFPQKKTEELQNVPPLSTQFILLGVCAEWRKSDIAEITKMIANQTLDYSIQYKLQDYKFIKLIWKGFDFAEFLIQQKKMGAAIGRNVLIEHFSKIIKQQKGNGNTTIGGNVKDTTNNGANNNNNFTNNNHQSSNKIDSVEQATAVSSAVIRDNTSTTGSTSSTSTIKLGMSPTSRSTPRSYCSPRSINTNQMVSPRSLSTRLEQATLGNYAVQNVPMYSVPVRMQHNVANWTASLPNQLIYGGQLYCNQPVTTVPYATSAVVLPPNIHPTFYQPQNFQRVIHTYQRSRDNTPTPTPTPTSTSSPNVLSPRRTMPTAYTTINLPVGNICNVCVSFVENGPGLFCVQLLSSQTELADMMNTLEKMKLKPFTQTPTIGKPCIARFSDDSQLYRALITNIQPTSCKVNYIDYGNNEMLTLNSLYEIPESLLTPKAFAIRFALSGCKELEPIDDSLRKAFKELVSYKTFRLEVMPPEGPPLVQYCRLSTNESDILDILKQMQKSRLVYAKAEDLENDDVVEIRYIDCPRNFYVQKIKNICSFEALMDDMFVYYNKSQKVPAQFSIGSPCIVKYENEWYRAEILRADDTAIVVRHVDFGFEQKVTKNLLSTIAEKHLRLPRQAVQCCLHGFQNAEVVKDIATTQFEMLAEQNNEKRRSFNVKIYRKYPDGLHIINLISGELNVMKKLYKLSIPFQQYLQMEKDSFNVHSPNGNRKDATGLLAIVEKASSVSSQNSITSSKKSSAPGLVNLSENDSPPHLKQTAQKHQQNQRRTKGHNANANQNDNDKNSSASSLENRESRSSSREHMQNKRQNQQLQQHQQYGKGPMQQHNANVVANDRRTYGGGNNYVLNKPRISVENIPPRFQNKRQFENGNRQFNKHNANVQQHQQRRTQRSQNAPQGYSPPINQLNSSFKSASSLDSTESSTLKIQQQENIVEGYMPLDNAFPTQPIYTATPESVVVCWWISPHQFYIHLKKRASAFESLMDELQKFYKSKSPQQLQLKVGSNVIARNRKENILYRARIIACNQMLRKYKVFFIDYGSQYTVTSEDLWQVEKRFANFPCMAYLCGFRGIISNFDHLYIIDHMERYLPSNTELMCEFHERENEMYYVDLNVGRTSLKETLKKEGFITEISKDLRLNLLAGQQICAKISSIKDMLNFKIIIEGCDKQIELLCCYDDLRYVKSNPDIAEKFKQFYEGKSCVFNIKEVNDNKVVLLRPLIPLLKDDIPYYICTTPILFERFDVNIVHVASSYRLYGHLLCKQAEINQLLLDMNKFYPSNAPKITDFEVGKICAAHCPDRNWYRARIVGTVKGEHKLYEVFLIDYGHNEQVEKLRLRVLKEIFYKDRNAYAIEINLPLKPLTESKSKKAVESTEINIRNAMYELVLNKNFSVQILQMHRNRVIADMQTVQKRSVMDLLKDKKMINEKDMIYIQKLLDKEKPNVLEYIELVDLTGDDDYDTDKKNLNKNKASSSPKKKKPIADTIPAKMEKPMEKHTPKVANEVNVPPNITPTLETTSKPEKILTEIKSEVIESQPQVEQVREEVEIPKIESPPTPPVDPYAHMERAALSHCDNPAQFFVHPMDKIDELRHLQENLQIVASSLPPLMRVINGAYCISLYSVDKQWYRARIMDAELMVLQFIDYGNTDCVSDTTDIKEMSVFPDIAPLCMPCALPIKPNGTADWVDAANAIFNDSYTKVLHYEYITQGDYNKRSFINLFIEGVNIAEKLVKDGFAKPLEVVNSGEDCYISHLDGPNNFYIQYEKDSKALELIEMHLEDESAMKPLSAFEEMKIVAALFSDDGRWYRAKLLQQLPEGYEVLFIDYGNTSITTDCREISDKIIEIPALSKKCALGLPADCLDWSEEAEKKFAEIAALGETIFTVELQEPAAHHAIVHLFIDGRNINDDLDPLCEHKTLESELNISFNASTLHTSVCENGIPYEVFISHINSPADFYVQFNKDTIRLEEVNSNLNTLGMDVVQQPEIGQLCAALYTEDSTYYRARILEIVSENDKQYRVCFIDFGNEAVVSDVRILPQDLQQLKEYCKRCQLENVSNFEKANGVASELFLSLISKCEGLVKIEIIDSETEPCVVRVFTLPNEECIYDKLDELLNLNTNANVPVVDMNTCLISYALSPKEFYIQSSKDSTKLELVAKALEKSNVEEQPLAHRVFVNEMYAVYSAEDDCYYRGLVEELLSDDEGYDAFLIDQGCSIKSNTIRNLPKNILEMPGLAVKCQLNAIPDVADNILAENFNNLLDEHLGDTYKIKNDISDPNTGVHTVTLEVNYKDFAEELAEAVNRNITEKSSVFSPVPVLHNCNVICINSPLSFYVQLAEDIPAIDNISEELLSVEKDLQPLMDIRVGILCAALYPDSGAYYRAEILEVQTDGKCEVHYIDFGNNAIISDIRELPKDLKDIGRYSKHCALEGNFNTEQAHLLFDELIGSRFAETFQIEFLKTNADPEICSLFYQNKNVATELRQALKEANSVTKAIDISSDGNTGENIGDNTENRPTI